MNRLSKERWGGASHRGFAHSTAERVSSSCCLIMSPLPDTPPGHVGHPARSKQCSRCAGQGRQAREREDNTTAQHQEGTLALKEQQDSLGRQSSLPDSRPGRRHLAQSSHSSQAHFSLPRKPNISIAGIPKEAEAALNLAL